MSAAARPALPEGRLRDAVRIATWAYLGVPLAIFLLGWLRPAAGLPLAAAAAWAVASAWRGARPRADGAPVRSRGGARSALPFVLGALPLLGHAAISGAGGVGFQTYDWLKHEAILHDLVHQAWPVAYATDAGPVALVYYTAYYLPAALVGKLAGWEAAHVALFAWHLAGLLLAWLWLVVLARVHPLVASLLFLGGWSWQVWENTFEDGLHNTLVEVWEGANFAWQPQFVHAWTNASLFWAPNQALGSWLVTALALDGAVRGSGARTWALLLAAALLWSPFGAVGLAPLLALLAVVQGPRTCAREALGGAGALGAVLVAVLGLYVAARWHPYALPDVFVDASAERNGFLLPRGGAPQDVSRAHLLGLWAKVSLAQVLLPLLPVLVWHRQVRLPLPRGALAALCTGLLLGLPLVKYGFFSDLMMRASAPAYFVLMVFALDLVAQLRTRPVPALAMLAAFAVGGLTGAAEISRQARRSAARPTWVRVAPPGEVMDLFALHVYAHRYDFARQYLGAADAPFFRALAAPLEPRRIPLPAKARSAPPAKDGTSPPAPSQSGQDGAPGGA